VTGDFSRLTFDSRKRYSGVLMQQGRVDMDADWNEAVAIDAARSAAEFTDLVGDSGVQAAATPGSYGAFQLVLDGSDLRITPGRAYLAGIPCELGRPTVIRCQPIAGEPTRVTIFTWVVDGWPFAVGQTLEVFDTSNQKTEVTIQDVDPDKKVLTLSTGVPQAQCLSRVATYCWQPFAPPQTSPLESPGPSLNYVAYLDSWQRVITALEDPSIADVALNGADTAVRTQTAWQVKLMPVLPTQSQPSNQEALTDWEKQLGDSTTPRGQMSAALDPTAATLLENQMYRVQIHCGSIPSSLQPPASVAADRKPGQPESQVTVSNWTPDGVAWDLGQTLVLTPKGGDATSTMLAQVLDLDQPSTTLTLDVTLVAGWSGTLQRVVTFTWARDNASLAVAIVGVGSNTLTVDDANPRAVGAFHVSDWVEVSAPERALAGQPGVMLRIARVEGSTLTFDYLPREIDATWTVRLWNAAYATLGGIASPHRVVTSDSGDLALEHGIVVAFSTNSIFLTGDYWYIVARANTQTIDWPDDGGPRLLPPAGPQHRVMPLAVLTATSPPPPPPASPWIVNDARPAFAASVDLLDRRGDIMTGPLLVDDAATTRVLPDANTPYDVVTSHSMYVGNPGASRNKVPRLPSAGLQPSQIALAANGGFVVYSERQRNSFICLLPGSTGNNPAGVRAILMSSISRTENQVTTYFTPSLEIHDAPDVTDSNKALVKVSVERRGQPCQLLISSPKTNDSQQFTVHIAGNLQVDGNYPGRQAQRPSVTAAAANANPLTGDAASVIVNQARPVTFPDPSNSDRLVAGFAAGAPPLLSSADGAGVDLTATIAALTAVVQSQTSQITELRGLLAHLSSRVDALEGKNS
jgi:hypothetical protein